MLSKPIACVMGLFMQRNQNTYEIYYSVFDIFCCELWK